MSEVLSNPGVAVRGIAAVAILAGILVLGGSIAADHRRRVCNAVVLKVVGATKLRIMATFLTEAGLLGALGLSRSTARHVCRLGDRRKIMRMRWEFAIEPLLWTLFLALAVTTLLGFRVHGERSISKPLPFFVTIDVGNGCNSRPNSQLSLKV